VVDGVYITGTKMYYRSGAVFHVYADTLTYVYKKLSYHRETARQLRMST